MQLNSPDSSVGSNYFIIDHIFGKIYLAYPLDYNDRPSITLDIVVTDGGGETVSTNFLVSFLSKTTSIIIITRLSNDDDDNDSWGLLSFLAISGQPQVHLFHP